MTRAVKFKRVPVDSPQNQLAPTNSPHIYANSPKPITRPTLLPTRPTYMPTRPHQLARNYTNSPKSYYFGDVYLHYYLYV